jgi:hypothetical protein
MKRSRQARKELLLAQAQLQRMQLALHVDDARMALRPASLVASAIMRPAALFALATPLARVFGWYRIARALRFAGLALGALRAARAWRASSQSAPPE